MGGASSPEEAAGESGPYLATGFKVGEVTADSAIVWVRTTREAQPNPGDRPGVRFRYAGESEPRLPKGSDQKLRVSEVVYPPGGADALPLAVPGAPGEVRVRYRAAEGPWRQTDWQSVRPERDHTRQIHLAGLRPGTRYRLGVQSRRPGARQPAATLRGGFGTAPARDRAAPVRFTVVTGQNAFRTRDRDDGFEIHHSMLALEPDFFVHTGDIVYYDRLGKTLDLARYHWQYTYGLSTPVAFHRQVASYFIKDDHDVWQDDCWPGMKRDNMHELTFEQGQAVFREQVPMGERTYRTTRWGRDLQVWLVEGRDFRSPNDAPDGPDKTIWGAEQKAWFKETVEASDATFRVLISPTPVVGPDRPTKRDNHSNPNFAHEGDELRSFLAAQRT